MIRSIRSTFLMLAAGVYAAAAPPAPAAEDVATAAARAQAAFFARDAATLAQLVAATTPWAKSANPRELYAYAYVQFRTQQVAMLTRREDDAERAGDACVAATDAAVKRDPKFTEAFALQSSCYGYLAGLGGLGAIRNGSRSGKAVTAALALEPRNPRVLLTDAFGLYQRPKIAGGDKLRGCAKFRDAAAAFDAAATAAAGATPVPGTIGWGAPEAHYWVGRCATEAGNAAAARPEYARALALAPDFNAAKQALGR